MSRAEQIYGAGDFTGGGSENTHAEGPCEYDGGEKWLTQTECGIVAAIAPPGIEINGAELLSTGVRSIAHRGQGGYGMVTFEPDGRSASFHSAEPVNTMTSTDLGTLDENPVMVMGHTRWATSGGGTGEASGHMLNAHPFSRTTRITSNEGVERKVRYHFMVNGNTEGARRVWDNFCVNIGTVPEDIPPEASDSYILAALIQYAPGETIEEKMTFLLNFPEIRHSAYNMVIGVSDPQALDSGNGPYMLVYRDPHAVRPLWWGEKDGIVYINSETEGLNQLGVHDVYPIPPGEGFRIDRNLITRIWKADNPEKRIRKLPHQCVFELLYFMRAGSFLRPPADNRDPFSGLGDLSAGFERPEEGVAGRLTDNHPIQREEHDPRLGVTVAEIRRQIGYAAGEELRNILPDNAIIIPIPASGVLSAEGFAKSTGLPLCHVLHKIIDIRSYISGIDGIQKKKLAVIVNHKIPAMLRGKHLVFVDDSMIGGSSAKAAIEMFKEWLAGLTELGITGISVVSTSPPLVEECHLGANHGHRWRRITNRYLRQMYYSDGHIVYPQDAFPVDTGAIAREIGVDNVYFASRGALAVAIARSLGLNEEEIINLIEHGGLEILHELGYCGACIGAPEIIGPYGDINGIQEGDGTDNHDQIHGNRRFVIPLTTI